MRYVWMILFFLTIPIANWLIGNIGNCIPNGPCLISVWPEIMAPSGVVMAGAALVLRDFVHEQFGAKWTIAAIFAGALLSLFVSPSMLAIASASAFLLSELIDLCVYAPLRKKGFVTALVGSSIVGAIVDSTAFLLIAFKNVDYLPGQVIGKTWAIIFVATIYAMQKKYLITFDQRSEDSDSTDSPNAS
jgi:uncharacterized PurR-regulated membrane protein YhhQ (DUF165 family)